MTGKWRFDTVGVNVPVKICGISVFPGDLVVADETGICFVPYARLEDVLREARAIADKDSRQQQLVDEGVALSELVAGTRKITS